MLFGAWLITTKTNNNKITWFKASVHTNPGLEKKNVQIRVDICGHGMQYDMPVGTSARAPISAPARPSADHQQRHFELSTQKNTAVACYLEHGL